MRDAVLLLLTHRLSTEYKNDHEEEEEENDDEEEEEENEERGRTRPSEQ